MPQPRRPPHRLPHLPGSQTLYRIYILTEIDNRVKKRKRAEPIPRNAFPHVVEKVGFSPSHFGLSCLSLMKGLVSDAEARELYNM